MRNLWVELVVPVALLVASIALGAYTFANVAN